MFLGKQFYTSLDEQCFEAISTLKPNLNQCAQNVFYVLRI